MAFVFEELEVYNKALDFALSVISAIDEIETPRKHYANRPVGSILYIYRSQYL